MAFVEYLISGVVTLLIAWEFYKINDGILRKIVIILMLGYGSGLLGRAVTFLLPYNLLHTYYDLIGHIIILPTVGVTVATYIFIKWRD